MKRENDLESKDKFHISIGRNSLTQIVVSMNTWGLRLTWSIKFPGKLRTAESINSFKRNIGKSTYPGLMRIFN